MTAEIKSHGAEYILIALLTISLVIGIWHALPQVDVVGDEEYFVGGVLKAFERHTIAPAGTDVPYGTLTYFLNYLFMIPVLGVMLAIFGFDISQLKLALIQSPGLVAWVPRAVSVALGAICIIFIYKILKSEVEDAKSRIFLMVLMFTNMIVALIMHTGKMWVLSTLLVLFSFYYLYRAIYLRLSVDKKILQQNIFFSITFAFLAVANFPLNIFSLMNILLIFFFFWSGDKHLKYKILIYIGFGIAIFALVTLINFEGIKAQIVGIFTEYRPLVEVEKTANLTILGTFLLNIKKTAILFPLFLLTIGFLIIKRNIRNKTLFLLALLYFCVYFILISIVATWAPNSREFLRYLFPLAFFLTFIIASFDVRFSRLFYVFGLISIIFWITTLHHLSAPTTYNYANNWIYENLNKNGSVIMNNIGEFSLPRNKISSLAVEDRYCGVKCRYTIEYDLYKEFVPLVFDDQSRQDVELEGASGIYYIEYLKKDDENLELANSFANNIDDDLYYLVDYNSGNYFDLRYFTIRNFGKNIYIYKQAGNSGSNQIL